jgi:peroxidase
MVRSFVLFYFPFNLEQLNEIRKISYSRIVCDNSDIRYMQPLVFKLISDL